MNPGDPSKVASFTQQLFDGSLKALVFPHCVPPPGPAVNPLLPTPPLLSDPCLVLALTGEERPFPRLPRAALLCEGHPQDTSPVRTRNENLFFKLHLKALSNPFLRALAESSAKFICVPSGLAQSRRLKKGNRNFE